MVQLTYIEFPYFRQEIGSGAVDIFLDDTFLDSDKIMQPINLTLKIILKKQREGGVKNTPLPNFIFKRHRGFLIVF